MTARMAGAASGPSEAAPEASHAPAVDAPRFRVVEPHQPEPPQDRGPLDDGKPSVAPKRRRRRDAPLVGYLSGVFTFFTLLVLALGGALIWGKSSFDSPGPLDHDTTVMVNRNQGVGEIADSLARAGVIESPKVFEAGVRMHGANDRLRYGEYAFPAHVSMREAMEILASGKSIEHLVTIPEGLTSLQIVDRLRDQPLLTGDIKEVPPEGSLLPETYKFTRGTPREQIVARMQQHQKAALDDIWRDRTPSSAIKTPEELVVLASIVEKETGVPEERARVAAVFANRLAKGMKLQSDPTIVYGIVAGRGTLGRSLTRGDINNKTPYNTYAIRGLPAGPITNPGRQALEAAARPAKTGDLYFVADGSGGHAFAATLVEHNKNVAKWRQVEKSRGLPADRLDPADATPEAANDTAPDQASQAAPAANDPASSPAVTSSSSSSDPSAPKPKPADRRHRQRQ